MSGPTLTSQPLLIEAVQEGATVIAKCWTGIGLVAESVLSVVILKLRTTKPSDMTTWWESWWWDRGQVSLYLRMVTMQCSYLQSNDPNFFTSFKFSYLFRALKIFVTELEDIKKW